MRGPRGRVRAERAGTRWLTPYRPPVDRIGSGTAAGAGARGADPEQPTLPDPAAARPGARRRRRRGGARRPSPSCSAHCCSRTCRSTTTSRSTGSQAQALAAGHLFPPATSPADSFTPWLAVVRHGHYVLKYTPVVPGVHALSLALTGGFAAGLALLAAAGVVVTYLLGCEVLGDRRVAALAAVLWALSPLTIVQSALLLPYLPFVVLLELTVLGTLRGLRLHRAGPLAGAGFALGLARGRPSLRRPAVPAAARGVAGLVGAAPARLGGVAPRARAGRCRCWGCSPSTPRPPGRRCRCPSRCSSRRTSSASATGSSIPATGRTTSASCRA